ncbi:C-3 sterol dehydrogenase/C-4 decarboxylase-like protein [Aaosphaeria arxii CBS 175.79]|uniref:C-3 sterol dehydrogenase/C-4 decarboxylase-like protein n=1 Tax=Aaosphaeria arxii CBS 175.79 TaxID=1450172 RepID=A0A6A5XUK5_9PLEO|nr:C-3 sterol dehydrogenase/C-4 decarboxylase-like protein [Aaosphaeria arxii CBS 175.79]KAF2015924.1 C-3 sterol dehydrogenase/C-4 decarboxylase-like protein [Aaosphaeria arxii CBS 175.79]
MSLTKVLVTGGTGFLGSEIVKALLEEKTFEVTVVDINPPSLGTGSFSTVRYVRANIMSPSDLHEVFQEAKPAFVIHTVGVYPLGPKRYKREGSDPVFAINVEGTRNIVEASKECGARGLVFTSSVTVLFDEMGMDFRNADETWPTGRLQTAYGESKAEAEKLVLSANTSDFKTCALRAAPILGPNDVATTAALYRCINRGETPFIIGDGTNLFDFVYVSNVADAHVLAVQNLFMSGAAAGEAFFITNGEPVVFRDFCLAVWKEFDHYPPFQITIPTRLGWWLGWGVEWASWLTGREGTFCRGAILDATDTRYVSISKARRILRYEPKVKLSEAVRISCQHFKEQLKAQAKR